MKLLSLKFIPRGTNGWESPQLVFGERTTSLYAPNGSGKTPLIQAIAFCLGFNTNFREEIREHCFAVSLTFEHGNHVYEASRELSKEFHLTIRTDGNQREFFGEGDFSAALFQSLKLTEPVLISTTRTATKPYASTLLPIFYVKQDGGYFDPYKASASFIQDQFVEMIRFAFGLAPKRSYSVQKELLKAKDELDAVHRRIVNQQKVVTDLSARIDDSVAEQAALEGRATLVSSQLNDLQETVDSAGAANDVLRDLLNAKDEKLRAAKRLQFELNTRIAGIDSIRGEIEGEIKTLSLNEESKQAFESFGDICNSPECGLFLASSESYAKNLMYLKDQIKDMESNSARAVIQLEELDNRIHEDENERTLILSKMNKVPQNSVTQKLVTAVQTLTRELLEIEQKRSSIEVLREERRKYIQLDSDRSKIQDRISMLSSNTRADFEFNKLRAKIRDSLVRWMDILQTLNVSHEIDIDPNFKFKFGTESLEIITGSTRTRLVLAIHAAIFEAYLENPDNQFRFLVLDTPKQHELNGADLANYLKELQTVCDELGGQIIISSTEYRHAIGATDQEWLPEYPGDKQPMYLGKPKTITNSPNH